MIYSGAKIANFDINTTTCEDLVTNCSASSNTCISRSITVSNLKTIGDVYDLLYVYKVDSGVSPNKVNLNCIEGGQASHITVRSNSTVDVTIYLNPLDNDTAMDDFSILMVLRGISTLLGFSQDPKDTSSVFTNYTVGSGAYYSGKDRYTSVLSFFSKADMDTWYAAYPDVRCSVLQLKPGCKAQTTPAASSHGHMNNGLAAWNLMMIMSMMMLGVLLQKWLRA
ncbi:hypothetical protein DFJ73DRAFT_761311 [Zopfochytrium polystomum]|nr:hypothetical protein DFJ73DRAFT_761311 [Zopfochytrium polystomum]